MSELWRDLRAAVRTLIKSPTFSVVAILTLSLGIGATTAIYTVVHSVLLEPLAYPEPERLVLIQEKNPEAGLPRFALSPLNFRDYRAMSTASFAAMAARTGNSLALTGEAGGDARRLNGRAVTADFLKVLGVTPILGRDFTAEDDRPGAPRVIILAHTLWQDLGADPGVIGQDLRIDGEPTTVIGVLPPDPGNSSEALVPLAHDYADSNRGSHWLIGFGRLAPGVSVAQARAELESIAANLEATYPDSNTGWGAIVDPLLSRIVENVRTALWVLLAAVGLVLLIACANVANLTLARLASREREVALRSALGAGRWQLMRQMLAESTVLSLVAGVIGVALAARGTAWLVAINADDIPRAENISLDGGVLFFALLATLGTALLFGLVPALQSSRVDLTGALKEGGRQAGGVRGQGLRRALVLAEVALALVLLVGAGLLIKSFSRLLTVDPGFQPEGVWTAGINLPEAAYPEEAERIAFYRRLVEEAPAVPGVQRAATVMPMPLSGGDWVNTTYLEGEPIPEPNKEHNVNVRFVSPGYFETLGIPIKRGRGIDFVDDADGQPAVVVNERAAAAFWGDRDPLGTRISFGRPDDDDVRWYTVVGIAGDVHHRALESTVEPAFYRAVLQDAPGFATIVLRTAGEASSVAAGLRALMRRLDPNLPLVREQAASDLVRSSVAAPRFNSTLLGIFAALALVLAAIGVFGVVSYAVSQRLREFGVRLALGAGGGQIVRLVLAQGMRPVLYGIVLGLLVAVAASRLLASLVHGVSTADPSTYALVGALLAAVAAVACLLPALRATRTDPLVVLRDE